VVSGSLSHRGYVLGLLGEWFVVDSEIRRRIVPLTEARSWAGARSEVGWRTATGAIACDVVKGDVASVVSSSAAGGAFTEGVFVRPGQSD
jgi:hypothetical protein